MSYLQTTYVYRRHQNPKTIFERSCDVKDTSCTYFVPIPLPVQGKEGKWRDVLDLWALFSGRREDLKDSETEEVPYFFIW